MVPVRTFLLYLLAVAVTLMFNAGVSPLSSAQDAVATKQAISVPENPCNGFTQTESAILHEVLAIRRSADFAGFQRAFDEGKPKEWKIAGRTILVEPAAPFSGFTLMGENGFVLGAEAFVSEAELTKTLLHELYRLEHSRARSDGVGGEQATVETQSAFEFSEKAYRQIEAPGFRP